MCALKCRNFTFTDFDTSSSREEWLKAIECSYIVWGRERCPSTGREHLQGTICFPNPRTLKPVIKLLAPNHVEPCKDLQASIKYCKKDGDFKEYGTEPKGQGTRTDLKNIRDELKTGKSFLDLIESDSLKSYSHIRMAQTLETYYAPKRNFKPEVRWYYGTTGTGKTRSVFEEFPPDDIYNRASRDNGTLWFTGYKREKVMLLDDFRADMFKFNNLLRFLDRYPYDLRIHGGVVPFVSSIIIITSPYHPRDVYTGRTTEDINQLLRRIDIIKDFSMLSYNAPDTTLTMAPTILQETPRTC